MTERRFVDVRDADRTRFLKEAGWSNARLEWRPGDASFRRYARLTMGSQHAMLMDAPTPKEATGPFIAIGQTLAEAGLSPPSILASNEEQGFLLLEDFGDDTFTNLLNRGADAAPLYLLATDVLVQMRLRLSGPQPSLPAYSPEARTDHLITFLDWLWPECMGAPPSSADRIAFNTVWREALEKAPTLGRGFVHRDFHVDNLMRLPDRNGPAACGVLDFQDAGDGPFAYDLASLLEDARRDIAPAIREACLERYQAACPDLTTDEISWALAVHGGQRHCRVAGLWVRLWRRDGKPGYLKHMQRTLNLLENSLRHPAMANVHSFLDDKFPAAARQKAIGLATEAGL